MRQNIICKLILKYIDFTSGCYHHRSREGKKKNEFHGWQWRVCSVPHLIRFIDGKSILGIANIACWVLRYLYRCINCWKPLFINQQCLCMYKIVRSTVLVRQKHSIILQNIDLNGSFEWTIVIDAISFIRWKFTIFFFFFSSLIRSLIRVHECTYLEISSVVRASHR